jgi:hypothetical protein
MPENSDLLAAAQSIANADEIIKSLQVLAHIPNVADDDTRALLRRLFEILIHQNEALESLRSAIAKLGNSSPGSIENVDAPRDPSDVHRA